MSECPLTEPGGVPEGGPNWAQRRKKSSFFAFHQRMAEHSMAEVIEWPPRGIEIRLGRRRGGGGVCVCVKFNVRRGRHAQPLINKLSD